MVLGGGEKWERYGRVRGRRPSRGWWTIPEPEPRWAVGEGMVKGEGGDGSGCDGEREGEMKGRRAREMEWWEW